MKPAAFQVILPDWVVTTSEEQIIFLQKMAEEGECKAVHGDGTDLPVSWQQHRYLPNSRGALRLRFILQNAGPYSFNAGEHVDLFHPERNKIIKLKNEP